MLYLAMMKLLINLFVIYFLMSNFSYSDHHVQNKQKHEQNHIDDLVNEIDEIEHDHSSHDNHNDTSNQEEQNH